MDLRRQRIENEWSFLQRMAAANPGILTIKDRIPDEFRVTLRETNAPIRNNGNIEIVNEHQLRLSFARFFPAIPMEIYRNRPVFHPNVHPSTGFVCLWNKSSISDTVVEALIRLQRVLTCSLFTDSPDHVMQPAALRWMSAPNRDLELPLHCIPLSKPDSWDKEHGFRSLSGVGRSRLS